MNEDLLQRILNSVFLKKTMGKAGRMTSNSAGLLNLLKNAFEKLKGMDAGGVFDLIRDKVLTIGKLLKCYASGEYRDIETKNLIIMIAGMIYFISPIDLLPDFLPLLGYADDIALLTFVLQSIGVEIEKFELWQMNQNLN